MEHSKNNSYTAINWNNIEDELDKATWEKLTQQFWLDTRIPISNDLRIWRGNMSPQERQTMNLVFGGLTTLDTLQSQDGMSQLKLDAVNQKEEAVLNNIQFMESVHAKSYSSIFETLNQNLKLKLSLIGLILMNFYNTKLIVLTIFIRQVHLYKRKLLQYFWKLFCFILAFTRHCIS